MLPGRVACPSFSRFAALVCVVVWLGACSERNDWDVTRSADTHEAYLAFAAKHPDSPHAAEAKQLAAERREQRDWRLARSSDTAPAYRAFLGAHPEGRWSDEARTRLETLTKSVAPAAATTESPSATAAAETLVGDAQPDDDVLPPPEPEPGAASPGAAANGAAAPPVVRDEFAGKTVMHRIQLGAFSSREKALAGWQEARTQHVELQGLVPQVLEVSTARQTMFRLQASVLSEQRAREACKALLAAGQPCLYVRPGR